ncbi:hypothetical protein [Chitinophaga agrisoli]|uniref:hypothetical protein n=1 Tax=Chitinophaga agrisoli TaxID=2607653 RepID=UPI001661E325|nr:hypothetical protein [Chitinophaga agrisoli]
MGCIKEPKGVDFVVDPTPLTEQDKSMIHEAIAYYRQTGRKKRTVTKKPATKQQKAKRS